MVEHGHAAYLDHASASPIDARVLAEMLPFLGDVFGNPESVHDWAREPWNAVERARADVAALIGGSADGVVFTAGDTEARNLAIKGIVAARASRGRHVVTTAVEHPAVVATCRSLARDGGSITIVGVDATGVPLAEAVAAAVRDDTVLVSMPHVQPEIGTILPVADLCSAIRARSDVAIHVDCGASAGLVPIDVESWGCDAVTVGGGSLFGPRWCGALWVRDGTPLHPLIEGGLQEGGKRGGHHDVPGIAGLGAAARLAREEMTARSSRMARGARRLAALAAAVDGVRLNGDAQRRVPGHVHVSVDDVEGETLALALAARGVACAPGSACTAAGKASAVLEAIGLRAPLTHSSVLFTLAPSTTDDEIHLAATAFATEVARLRALNPDRATA